MIYTQNTLMMFSSLLQEKALLKHVLAAADWCQKSKFEGAVKLPAVLSMDEEEKLEILQELESWEDAYDESSPAEMFTFVFEKKSDYEKFTEEVVDNKDLKVFARFEQVLDMSK